MTEPAALKIPPCPRKCSTCQHALHHWIEDCLDPHLAFAEDAIDTAIIEDWREWRRTDPEHAPPVGPVVWRCAHCTFWMRHYDNCPGCEGPVDAQGVCVTMCGEVDDGSEFDMPVSGDDAEGDGYYKGDPYMDSE